jgi:hypothetical protein
VRPSLPLEVAHAWRGAVFACALNVIGMALDLAIGRTVPGLPWWPNVASGAVGAALVGVLFARRARATVRLGSVVFLVNNTVIVAALWITSGYYAASNLPWTPYQANKLGIMAIALLAPELWVGVLCILENVAMVIGKHLTFPSSIQDRLAVGEPWLIMIFGVFGAVLLAYRLRGVLLERERLRLHARAATADEVARLCLALRDALNTPIQTVRLSTAVLRMRPSDVDAILDRIDRALDRLSELSGALTQYEAKLKWRPGDESPGHLLAGPAVTESSAARS